MAYIDPDKAPSPAFVLTEQRAAFDGHWHKHRRAQFIYAHNGVLTTRTKSGLWVVPPGRALWILPGELHKGFAPKSFLLRTLYIEPDIAPSLKHCCVVSVDKLLDALIVEASTFGTDFPKSGPQWRLMEVIFDRLANLETTPSFLPTPEDARLKTLTAMLESDVADQRPLEDLASASGMTARTAARLFTKETGLTFAQWRQQLRLLKSMQALSLGESVTNVAGDVGYKDVSAFIKVFKSAFGQTPANYFKKKR